jgi:3-oxoacyl-[acyl-carrier-protein] synthase II
MRRVVVTGLGLVTPLGGDVETTWQNLIAGKSGIGPITRFDTSDQKATIAGEVKPKDHPYGFDPDKRIDHKVQRQVDPFIVYAIDAAGQALEDAGLAEMSDEMKERAISPSVAYPSITSTWPAASAWYFTAGSSARTSRKRRP